MPQTSPQPKSKPPWLWNVVLLDDSDHTYDYVIRMMQDLFNHDPQKALQIAKTVDADGRAIVLTTHRELGELKIEQIHGFGRDPLLATCKGSMSAVLEPAEGEDDGHSGHQSGGGSSADKSSR